MLNFANANINFMGQRRLWLAVSALLIIGSIVLIATRGLNFGIDFTGGTVIEVGYPEPVELEQVREQLAQLVAAGANHLLLNPVTRYGEQVEALAEVIALR